MSCSRRKDRKDEAGLGPAVSGLAKGERHVSVLDHVLNLAAHCREERESQSAVLGVEHSACDTY